MGAADDQDVVIPSHKSNASRVFNHQINHNSVLRSIVISITSIMSAPKRRKPRLTCSFQFEVTLKVFEKFKYTTRRKNCHDIHITSRAQTFCAFVRRALETLRIEIFATDFRHVHLPGVHFGIKWRQKGA